MVASCPSHERFNESRIAHPPANQSTPLKENAQAKNAHNKDAQYYLRLYRQLEHHTLYAAPQLHDYAIQGNSTTIRMTAHPLQARASRSLRETHFSPAIHMEQPGADYSPANQIQRDPR